MCPVVYFITKTEIENSSLLRLSYLPLSFLYKFIGKGPPQAQWSLPFCGLGFEAIVLYLSFYREKNESKQKEAGFGLYLKTFIGRAH